MKKGHTILLIMNLVLISMMLFNSITHIMNEYVLVLFLSLFFIINYKYFGIEKSHKYNQKDIFFNIVIGCLSYTLITYLLGLWLGFLYNPYSFRISEIIYRTLPLILTIILSELIRYIFVKKGRNYKSILVLSVITFTLIDVTLITKLYNFSDNNAILEFILLLIAIITRNIFLTYVSHKYDYKIPIFYRLYMELPMYILPLFPKLGDYVDTLIKFLIPVVFIYIIKGTTIKEESTEIHTKKGIKVRKNLVRTLLVLIIIAFIGITCGWFKYFTLGIGSGSMTPNINKGDAVIVEKLNKNELKKLKRNDILVFTYNNKIIVHRIVDIKNGSYYTKGDYNKDVDLYPVQEKDIIGKANIKIRYIALPSVWLNEQLQK